MAGAVEHLEVGERVLGDDQQVRELAGFDRTEAIRGGIVYDAPALLADVRRIVADAKAD